MVVERSFRKVFRIMEVAVVVVFTASVVSGCWKMKAAVSAECVARIATLEARLSQKVGQRFRFRKRAPPTGLVIWCLLMRRLNLCKLSASVCDDLSCWLRRSRSHRITCFIDTYRSQEQTIAITGETYDYPNYAYVFYCHIYNIVGSIFSMVKHIILKK